VRISIWKSATLFDIDTETFTRDAEPKRDVTGRNLGEYTGSASDENMIIELPSWDTDKYQFQLHLVKYAHPKKDSTDGIIQHHISNRIVRISKQHRHYTGHYAIFDGIRIETVD